jgi:tryptophan halogenase
MKFDNIVIVGGGSAGWMTAATLIKVFPNKNITVVESADVSAVGVGESTTQLMRRWQHFLEIPDIDFLTKCNATNKLSIRFENFHKKDGVGFHYPFGRLDERYFNVADWFAHQSLTGVSFEDLVSDMSPISECLDTNKVPTTPFGDNFVGTTWSLENDAAWHFDTHKFYAYLRDDYCLPKGVKRVVAHVTDTTTDAEGFITSVHTKQGNITGDLFFDCTGFKRVLIEGAMNEPWVEFNNKTYTDSAWAAARPYKDKEKELRLYTNSVALDYGWVWEIPTWERIGTGYNYASKYISDEQALAEFKEYLGPVANEMEFRHIKMRNGMSKRLWVKNCVSIGLSGAFIEPLESNGLMSVHEFLLNFVNIAEGKDTLNNFDAHTFNHVNKEQFLDFADFVTIHYAMTVRDDTQYWRDIQNQEFNDSLLLKEIYNLRGANYLSIPDRFQNLGANTYMLAGHKINPYSSFKHSNMNFWSDTFPDQIYNLDTIIKPNNISKKKITDTFPTSVEYYGQFHS